MKRLTGIGASRGVAIGRLHFFDNVQRRVEMEKCESPERELERFEAARLQSIETLGVLHDKAMEEIGPEESMIFEIHQMMLEDDDYIDSVKAAINDEGYVAEYAVQQAGEQLAGMFALMDDAYMKERASDVLDISNRIIRQLRGELAQDLSDANGQLIIAARDLLPSETIQMDQSKVQAFVTSAGSKISHASILARTMGIPAVVGLEEQLAELREGDLVVVDGFNGVVLASPDDATMAEYELKRQEYLAYKDRLKKLKGTESKTQDGVRVEVCANIGHTSDVSAVLENDGEGIGLFRSEFLYMESNDFPTEQAQFEAYKAVLEKMGDRRVVVRTLDLGADKTAPYFNMPHEDNPAMGYRAIRICLRQTDIFKTQLRALLRASVYGRLAIMFPMITSVEEVQDAKKLLDDCRRELDAEGVAYSDGIEVGIMVETPAAAVISDLLAKEVDFFSIGTNDLTQYTLAVDRMNGNIGSTMYDPRHRAVLRLMRMTAENAVKNGIWCGICGESGADRKLTEAFLAMGVTELSVTPTAILEIREKIQSINLSSQKESVLERI